MSDYLRVLDCTEKHLQALRASGVRYLKIETNALSALSEAPVEIPTSVTSIAATNGIPNRAEEHPSPGLLAISPLPNFATPQGDVTFSAPPVYRRASAEPTESVILSYDGINGAESAGDMEELRRRASVCLKCPHLVKSRKNVVFGVGDIHAKLMFVGEAPGADEDIQGEPFVGAAGQLLTRIIKTMGLSRETVYIANILKCRPDTPGQSFGNRKPTPDEMKTCLPYLLAQIDLIKPKVLVALGSTAVEGLLGKGEGIMRLRGKFQSFRDIPFMPTFHPAYLLRNQALSEKRQVWEDMLKVMEKLEMPISEKQQAYFLK